jgi:gluconokinase
MSNFRAMVLIVMGVTASGKTTVGQQLAEVLGWPFYDGDDFHPEENVDKMRHGVPLTDADRTPWLERLHALIRDTLDRDGHAVIACSALRKSYRATLRGGLTDVRFVYLKVSRHVLQQRIDARRDHFMPPSLLDSQLRTLEEPADSLWIDGAQAPDAIVQEIRRRLPL